MFLTFNNYLPMLMWLKHRVWYGNYCYDSFMSSFLPEVGNLTKYFLLLKAWNDACNATFMRYWALVIGCPKEKEGVICAPLTKVFIPPFKHFPFPHLQKV